MNISALRRGGALRGAWGLRPQTPREKRKREEIQRRKGGLCPPSPPVLAFGSLGGFTPNAPQKKEGTSGVQQSCPPRRPPLFFSFCFAKRFFFAARRRRTLMRFSLKSPKKIRRKESETRHAPCLLISNQLSELQKGRFGSHEETSATK